MSTQVPGPRLLSPSWGCVGFRLSILRNQGPYAFHTHFLCREEGVWRKEHNSKARHCSGEQAPWRSQSPGGQRQCWPSRPSPGVCAWARDVHRGGV